MSAADSLRRWIADARLRRLGYLVAVIVLAILAVFPRPYLARAKILPQDGRSAGLNSLVGGFGGQLQSFASLLGDQQSINVYLAVGRSENVTDEVISRLKLVGSNAQYTTLDRARRALRKRVEVNSLPGGILQVETKTDDAEEAYRYTSAYVSAIGSRINRLGRENTERKRAVVQDRFKQASERVGRAEVALSNFRRANRLADPEAQLGAGLSLRAGLEARLQAKLVELQTVEKFAGAENLQLQAVRTEIAALRTQIGNTTRPGTGAGGPNIAGLSEISAQYLNLYRDYRFAQVLYELYSRLNEQVSVEELVSSSSAEVQIVESTHIDPQRQYNVTPAALFFLVILIAVFTEIYAPATGLMPARKRELGE
jgi:hypothetical protein